MTVQEIDIVLEGGIILKVRDHRMFWKVKLFRKFAIVLEGRMFWIRIVLPGARLRYQALRVD